MRNVLLSCLFAAMVPSSLSAATTARYIVELDANRGTSIAAKSDVLARFRSDLAALDRRFAKNGGGATSTIHHEYSATIVGAAVELAPESVDAVRALPNVRAIHVDHVIDALPRIAPRANAEVVDARARVNATQLQARGEGVVVAVIDSGIDYRNRALGGGMGPGFRVIAGYDFAQNDGEPDDVEGHGTHVAGIIAANAASIVGVAPDVRLVAYKVVHRNGDGLESSVVAALERCVDPNGDGDRSDHLDVVNLSLGWDAGPDSITARACDAATTAGVVIVAAAANLTASPARIKAPGVAASAITVANAVNGAEIAFDSARGPTPATLAFKPDIAAPGSDIFSLGLNGTLAMSSGTSMASPHVAGIAALLLELHPDWTPAAVKAAITSSAHSMPQQPFLRGAGFADASAASRAQFFFDASGLSFGIDPKRSGTFDATRTFTIANRSNAAATFDATAQSTPAGISVTITPSRFTIAPGATQTVNVRLVANNEQLPYPNDALAGGTIRLQSPATTLLLPWGLVRAARATFTFDRDIATLYLASTTLIRAPYPYSTRAAELYSTTPGTRFDALLTSMEPGIGRFILAEQLLVDDRDQVIELHAADSPRKFTLDARDEHGMPLSSATNAAANRAHDAALQVVLEGSMFPVSTYSFGNVRELYVPPTSTRARMAAFESLIDLDSRRLFGVGHLELTGESSVLTSDASTYVHGRMLWRSDRNDAQRFSAATHLAYERDGRIESTRVISGAGTIRNGDAIDLYLSPETILTATMGLSFENERIAMPMLLAIDGALAPAPDGSAPASSHRLQHDNDVEVGNGPLHPYAFFGTATSRGAIAYRSGFHGDVDEERRGIRRNTHWSLVDGNGVAKSSGWLDPAIPEPAITIARRDRFVATNEAAATRLEVTFGDQADDLAAPTFASLRVLDANGRTSARVRVGEAARLRFSATDFDYDRNLQTQPLRGDATRVFYRVHGTTTWLPLPVLVTGAEDGNLAQLGHVPGGTLHQVDLGAATAVAAFIDLRFELEDMAGNHLTWTQERAFAVGDVKLPPRRRAS